MSKLLVLFAGGTFALFACAEPAIDDRELDVIRSGGWDYNNNRFNSATERVVVGPTAPYGDAGPNTIDAFRNVVFHLQPSAPVACVVRDSTITAVRVAGSTGDGSGQVWGPRVMVQRGALSVPLAIGERTAIAALVRTQVMPLADARPVTLVVERVRDFVRPGGWIKWPQYAVWMHDDACVETWLAVSIFGPAMNLPTTSTAPMSLTAIPDTVVPYAGFYDETDPSVFAKAAVNFDAPFTVSGESGGSGQSCLTGAEIPANHLAFLGALATGAAVVTYHPSDPERRPVVVFRTKKGQPFRAIASAMVGGEAQSVCHRDDMRPPNTPLRTANHKVAWPVGFVTTLDVVHGNTVLTLAGEVVASSFTWLVSGTADARKVAFLESSENELRFSYSQQADDAIAAVSFKTQDGALSAWNPLNGLFGDRSSLVVAAETLPPSRAHEGAEHATDQRMLTVVVGDGVCSVGELASGSADCPFNPPPPTDGGIADAGPPVDAGSYTPDAGSYTPDASTYTPDAGSYTPDAGTYTPDAGTYSDGGGPG